MITQAQLNALYDAEVVDQDGHRIGTPDRVYLDSATGDPAWLTVRAGRFRGRKVFCPLSNAELTGSRIQVPYPAEVLRTAPEVAPEEHLTEEEETLLLEHYRVDEGPAPSA